MKLHTKNERPGPSNFRQEERFQVLPIRVYVKKKKNFFCSFRKKDQGHPKVIILLNLLGQCP